MENYWLSEKGLWLPDSCSNQSNTQNIVYWIINIQERFRNFQTYNNSVSKWRKISKNDLYENLPENIYEINKIEDLEFFDSNQRFKNDTKAIKSSKWYRRMPHKTQVRPLSSIEDVHMRTRFSHTEEVVRISYYIASMLNMEFKKLWLNLSLNTDLCEAIAYGHDVGHTPFWHVWEQYIIDKWYSEFKHNKFSVLLLDKIERWWEWLNLNTETLDWILLHTSDWGKLEIWWLQERAIVRLADKIAYVLADLNDAERMWYITEWELECANNLWTNQRERELVLMKEIVKQTILNWQVTLWDSKISKNFLELKNILKIKFYAEVDKKFKPECIEALDNVFWLLKNQETRIKPEIALPILTDSEVVKLSKEIQKWVSLEEIQSKYKISLFDILKSFEKKWNNPLDIYID